MEQLTDHERAPAAEPFERFGEALTLASESEPNDPTAMALSTVDPQGMPNLRMVLMKDFDQRGFVFYTNRQSAKGCSSTPASRRRRISTGRACAGRCACAARWKR